MSRRNRVLSLHCRWLFLKQFFKNWKLIRRLSNTRQPKTSILIALLLLNLLLYLILLLIASNVKGLDSRRVLWVSLRKLNTSLVWLLLNINILRLLRNINLPLLLLVIKCFLLLGVLQILECILGHLIKLWHLCKDLLLRILIMDLLNTL